MSDTILAGIIGVVGALGGSLLSLIFSGLSQRRQLTFEERKLAEDRYRWQFTYLGERKILRAEKASEAWSSFCGSFSTVMVVSDFGGKKDELVIKVSKEAQGHITEFEMAIDELRLYLTTSEFKTIQDGIIERIQDISMALEILDIQKAHDIFQTTAVQERRLLLGDPPITLGF